MLPDTISGAVMATAIGAVFVGLGAAILTGWTSFSIVPAFRGMARRYLGTATIGLGCCWAFLGWAAVARGGVHVVLLIGFGVALAVGMVSGWIGRRRPPDPD